MELAQKVFARLADDAALPVLLWEPQRDVFANPEERIYVHIGCHFNRIAAPGRDVSSYPRRALQHEIQGWQDYLRQNKPAQVKQNAERILAFLRNVLAAEP